jgi:dienelactone hydrolase
MTWRACRLLLVAVVLSGCGGGATTPSGPTGAPSPAPAPTPAPTPAPAAFQLSGDPESPSGATWTYRATTDGVTYDLRGILLKPRGPGPFPAVLLSHGGEQNALTMVAPAAEMVTWGLVGMATNYTHATDTGAPLGAPGTAGERGATQSNILRARKVLDLLAALGYVDMNRVAAFGISNGGFVTVATVATYPTAFRVAAHAAAGVMDPATGSPPSAPSPSLAAGVRIPYSLHHGDPDPTNPLSSDQRFASILEGNAVPHELWIYPGAGHVGFIQSPTFFTRIRAWYTRFGLF